MLPSFVVPLLNIEMSSYSAVRTLYFIAAFVLTLGLSARQGIGRDVIVWAFALGVPLGMAGAHLLDSLEYADRYQTLADYFGRDGSSIYGAFLVVLPLVWAYARWWGVPPLRLLDVGAPAMALGEAMTRVGCFLNGCCYGIPWDGPWAVRFPRASFAYRDQQANGLLGPEAGHSLPVHPVQLYSVVAMSIVFAVLLWQLNRRRADGRAFFTFVLAYGALRLAVAPLRTEALASARVFSLVFVMVGAAGLFLVQHAAGRRTTLAPGRALGS